MKKLFNLIRKYRELIVYLIVGVLTTLVNFAVYFVCTRSFNLSPYTSNIFAWVVAVLFAFVMNKFVVFQSKAKDTKTLLKEGISFVSMRVISLGFDMLILYVVINVINWSDLIAKLISQIVVIVLNYVFSKLFIFKNKK